MLRFIAVRLALLPILLLFFSVVVFILVQAPPGDFLTSYLASLASSGSSVDQDLIIALKQQFGLDQPLHTQYLRWMGNVIRGDLGLSLEYHRPNAELLGDRLVLTILLALFSFILTWVIAIPAGVVTAVKQHTWVDYVFPVVNYIGVAIPNFMLALILMWVA